MPLPCRCGRRVTGTHPCQSGAPCAWPEPRQAGRWGVLWAQDGEGE